MFKSFFTLKTMFLLLLRPSKIFIFFHSVQGSEWCLGGKRSPRRQRIRSSPPLYFRHSLDCCLADFANLSAHSPQWRRRRARKKQSTIERPTLYSQICKVEARKRKEYFPQTLRQQGNISRYFLMEQCHRYFTLFTTGMNFSTLACFQCSLAPHKENDEFSIYNSCVFQTLIAVPFLHLSVFPSLINPVKYTSNAYMQAFRSQVNG